MVDESGVHRHTGHHHTAEQVAQAFAYAPTLLRRLLDAGLPYPSFELYADASGVLFLGYEGDKITHEQYELACSLVRSNRADLRGGHRVAIVFCCGLVLAAEDAN